MGEQLFYLIASLSKEEKRYFKLFAKTLSGKNAKYLQLFDCLDGMPQYEEDTLKNLLRGKRWENQLSNYKKYLYELILKSLRVQHSAATVEEEILSGLQDAKILYRKKMIDPLFAKIQHLKKLAYTHDRFFYLPRILEWELAVHNVWAYKHWEQADVQAAQTAYSRCLSNINTYMQQRFQMVWLAFLVGRKSYSRKIAEDATFQNTVQQWEQESPPDTLWTALAYYQKQIILAAIECDTAKKLQAEKGIVQAMEAQAVYMYDVDILRLYFRSVLNLIASLPKDQKALIEAYEQKIQNMDINKLSSEEKFQYYNFSLQRHINRADFGQAFALAQQARPEIIHTGFTLQPLLTQVNICYFMGVVYFVMEQWDEAMNWFERTQAIALPAYNIIQNSARILGLTIFLEKGETIFLENAVRSLLRSLTKQQVAFDFERLWLRALLKIAQAPDSAERTKQLLKLESKIQQLIQQADSTQREPFVYFDYFVWIKSRAEQKPLLEIARQHWKPFHEVTAG